MARTCRVCGPALCQRTSQTELSSYEICASAANANALGIFTRVGVAASPINVRSPVAELTLNASNVGDRDRGQRSFFWLERERLDDCAVAPDEHPMPLRASRQVDRAIDTTGSRRNASVAMPAPAPVLQITKRPQFCVRTALVPNADANRSVEVRARCVGTEREPPVVERPE